MDTKEDIVNEIVGFFKKLYSSADGEVFGFKGVD